jgi:hypothetical protein
MRTSLREAGLFRLSRSFGQPRVGPDEVVALEMEQVTGVVRATLNEFTLPEVDDGKLAYLIEPALFKERNRLTLEVDGNRARGQTESDWGMIALVIRSTGSAL